MVKQTTVWTRSSLWQAKIKLIITFKSSPLYISWKYTAMQTKKHVGLFSQSYFTYNITNFMFSGDFVSTAILYSSRWLNANIYRLTLNLKVLNSMPLQIPMPAVRKPSQLNRFKTFQVGNPTDSRLNDLSPICGHPYNDALQGGKPDQAFLSPAFHPQEKNSSTYYPRKLSL